MEHQGVWQNTKTAGPVPPENAGKMLSVEMLMIPVEIHCIVVQQNATMVWNVPQMLVQIIYAFTRLRMVGVKLATHATKKTNLIQKMLARYVIPGIQT